MFVPRTRTQLGRRSFHVAAPYLSGTVFLFSCAKSPSISRGQFRARLKIRLFNQAYTTSLWERFVLRVNLLNLLTYLLWLKPTCIVVTIHKHTHSDPQCTTKSAPQSRNLHDGDVLVCVFVCLFVCRQRVLITAGAYCIGHSSLTYLFCM